MKSILTLSLASLLALPALAQQAQGTVQPAAPLVTPQPAVAPAVAARTMEQPALKTKKAHKKSAAAGKKATKKSGKKAAKPHKAATHAKLKTSHKHGKTLH